MHKSGFPIPTMRQTYTGPSGSVEGNLSVAEFTELSNIILAHSGIMLSDTKKIHVENKIGKRIQQIGLPSFDAYIKFLATPEGYHNEVLALMDIVTTNKTDFFREAAHFQFLRDEVLPAFLVQHSTVPLKIWSAGCSTGEEPYSLAITLLEALNERPGADFQIFASDISRRVLEEARQGIYEIEKLNDIPLSIKQRYFLKSKNSEKKVARVIPSVRAKINYAFCNLAEAVYPVPGKMDCIFCRNVIIYFDKQMQEAVVRRLSEWLNPGGYLFLGHSETILGMDVPVERVASTIYRRKP